MELSINKKDKIHLIGIGGIGMSGIALILKKMGYDVQGSDISLKSKSLDFLKKNKIKIFNNHKSQNIKNAKIVVISTAINKSNSEFQAAIKKKILIIRRADMLAHIISLKKNIVISGSHGKTTITSLVSTILKDANFKPTIVNGGIINSLKTNARLGDGDWSVIEADESDGSFLKFSNTIAVVSNIDHEHMDYYKNFSNLTKQFALFLDKTPLFGKNVVCLDDPSIAKLIKKSTKQNFLTYGFNSKADFIPTNLVYKNMKIYFDLKVNLKKKLTIKNVTLNLMGQHNVLNACKKNFNKHKIVSVFQPHRFSRVQSLYSEFSNCFLDSDLVVLCPVYAAGEKIINFDLEKFGKKIVKNSNTEVVIAKDEKNLEIFLQKNHSSKEVVIAMGAGSVSQWIRSISKKIKNAKN